MSGRAGTSAPVPAAAPAATAAFVGPLPERRAARKTLFMSVVNEYSVNSARSAASSKPPNETSDSESSIGASHRMVATSRLTRAAAA